MLCIPYDALGVSSGDLASDGVETRCQSDEADIVIESDDEKTLRLLMFMAGLLAIAIREKVQAHATCPIEEARAMAEAVVDEANRLQMQ